jgi:hypothetical protein
VDALILSGVLSRYSCFISYYMIQFLEKGGYR